METDFFLESMISDRVEFYDVADIVTISLEVKRLEQQLWKKRKKCSKAGVQKRAKPRDEDSDGSDERDGFADKSGEDCSTGSSRVPTSTLVLRQFWTTEIIRQDILKNQSLVSI